MNGEAMRATLRVTKALADLQRVRILLMLDSGELCVCQIVEVLGLAPSTVSKHLSVLAGAGLADLRKDGRWSYYRLPEGRAGMFVRPVLKWLGDALSKDEMVMLDRKKLKSVVATEPDFRCRQQRIRNQ